MFQHFENKFRPMSATTYNRYILNETNSDRAIEQGLAEADWYTCPIPKTELRKLLVRRDGPALRDTLLWFALLGISGYAGFVLWGSWWVILPFLKHVGAAEIDQRGGYAGVGEQTVGHPVAGHTPQVFAPVAPRPVVEEHGAGVTGQAPTEHGTW